MISPRSEPLLLAVVLLSAAVARSESTDSAFQKPVRLQAAGADIDTGEAWGHSGPCVADVDGDGLRDLVVGDFSGKFRFYRNTGTNAAPVYAAAKYLKAGNEDAKVRIYCCIGSSPQFADLDRDGVVDLFSGSYDPGACYLFRGLGGGKFAEMATIIDAKGNPVLRRPEIKRNYASFGSWPVLVDWNGDGAGDLLVGTFDGTMYVRLNQNSHGPSAWSDKNIAVEADGKELKVPGETGHAAPAIVDWDGDGRWDILSGSDNGGVYFFRNIGEATQPRFGAPQTLIPPHEVSGYDELLEVGAEPKPGIRSQIFAIDYNQDGKTDLLVGDFCTNITPRADLLPAERAQMQALIKEAQESIGPFVEAHDKLYADFKARYPGDEIYSDEADAAWSKAYKELRERPEFKDFEKKSEELNAAMEKYLQPPPKPGTFNKSATCHGYVWLYLRK